MPASDDLVTALRSRGLRVTSQREQVLATVRRLGHATPEEISAAVEGVDVTTVYRTLQLLEEIGLVAHTHLGHGAPSYQAAENLHLHVVCHSCGGVVTAPPGLGEEVSRRLRVESDFTVDLAHLTIFGQCADCVRTGAVPSAHLRSDHVHSDHVHSDHSERSRTPSAVPAEQSGPGRR
jgi:Fur family transcriptional regulator, ferric uptake regulator